MMKVTPIELGIGAAGTISTLGTFGFGAWARLKRAESNRLRESADSGSDGSVPETDTRAMMEQAAASASSTSTGAADRAEATASRLQFAGDFCGMLAMASVLVICAVHFLRNNNLAPIGRDPTDDPQA